MSFLDSNILIYAYSADARSGKAKSLIEQPFVLSVQVLNEFAVVTRRKMGFGWDHIESAIADIVYVAQTVHPVSLDLHIAGLRLAERYQLQFFDAVIIATALRGGCDVIFSEDMHDALVIDERLTIRNPFA